MTRFNPNKLYKDPLNGRCMGVCAGIADYFDTRASMVRLITIVLFFVGGGAPVIFAYVILGCILEKKPRDMYERPEEDKFWQKARTQPEYTKVDLNRRFEDIEKRTRNMEAYVTSKQFRLNRELRDLED